MSIISVLNPKGGCGKTTISTNLARALHDRGHSVLIVDSDPQGSARDWHAASEDNPLELVALGGGITCPRSWMITAATSSHGSFVRSCERAM